MSEDASASPPHTMVFTVVNGSDFRSVHATGAFVSSAPGQNECRLVIYSDRVPIEREMTYEMVGDKSHPNYVVLGKKIEAAGSESEQVKKIERELQIEVALSDHALANIHNQIGSYLQWRQKQTGTEPQP